MMRPVLATFLLAATVLTGCAFEARPPSRGSAPYPGAWFIGLTSLATISAVILLILGLSQSRTREKWSIVGSCLGILILTADASLAGYWLGPPAKIRFTDNGFTRTTYSVKYSFYGSMVTNTSQRTVSFCYGHGGVCDPSLRASPLLNSPGTTLAPGQYVRFHYPNHTADYPITAILDGRTTTGSDTVLYIVKYQDATGV
jgi:hypothetical protein